MSNGDSESSMDLKRFISDTLYQIVAGVQHGEQRIRQLDTNAVVNPTHGAGVAENNPESVAFDVAVTVSREQQGGGETAIRVLGLSLGGEGSINSGSEAVSRIRFKIPMTLPYNARNLL